MRNVMTMSVVLATAFAMMMFVSGQTIASPAIAQKTGEACAKCHAPAPPALNDYGKKYKK